MAEQRSGPRMTADEFERAYAASGPPGVTVEFLHHWGRYAEPCNCGEPECVGWAMGRQHEDALVENEVRDPRLRRLRAAYAQRRGGLEWGRGSRGAPESLLPPERARTLGRQAEKQTLLRDPLTASP